MKKFFIKNYLKCWEFFCKTRWFFVFGFGIFALTFLIGFAFPVFFRAEIFGIVKGLVLAIEGKNTLELIGFIFLNNLQASFMAMALGILFGFFPMMTCIVNGYLLGFVAREAVMTDGIFMMWKIFPHGIFELPAVMFSIGIGFRLGWSVVSDGWHMVSGKRKTRENGLGYNFREGLRFFVFVIVPLLVVAGVIEGILVKLM
ncbi:stage II sporulation protein M [Candidatus Pacearchaeota archaeon]|nr:stage II sporulation protein M [Candidatus Pacearchaeota archaeon]